MNSQDHGRVYLSYIICLLRIDELSTWVIAPRNGLTSFRSDKSITCISGCTRTVFYRGINIQSISNQVRYTSQSRLALSSFHSSIEYDPIHQCPPLLLSSRDTPLQIPFSSFKKTKESGERQICPRRKSERSNGEFEIGKIAIYETRRKGRAKVRIGLD